MAARLSRIAIEEPAGRKSRRRPLHHHDGRGGRDFYRSSPPRRRQPPSSPRHRDRERDPGQRHVAEFLPDRQGGLRHQHVVSSIPLKSHHQCTPRRRRRRDAAGGDRRIGRSALPRASAATPRDSEIVATQSAGVEARLPVVRDRLCARSVFSRLSGRLLSDRRKVRRVVAGRSALRRDAEHGLSVDRGALRGILSIAFGRVHIARILDTFFRTCFSFANSSHHYCRLHLGIRARDVSQSALLHPRPRGRPGRRTPRIFTLPLRPLAAPDLALHRRRALHGASAVPLRQRLLRRLRRHREPGLRDSDADLDRALHPQSRLHPRRGSFERVDSDQARARARATRG